MSNPYLARLRALDSEKGILSQPSKPSKPSYEGFEGDQGRRFLENQTSKVDIGLSQISEKPIPRQPSKPSKPDEARCLQCGGPIGPAAREITVRSTGTGQLATVHQDCFSAWQIRPSH
jgi:hypothetical protein